MVDHTTLKLMGTSLHITSNYSYYLQNRNSLNTSFGYTVTSMIWHIFEQQQLFLGQELFYVSRDIYLYDILLMAIPLEKHSLFKEPLDYLVHRVHDAGLLQVWQSSFFLDMLKYKNISLDQTTRHSKNYRTLNLDDFSGIWSILLIGLLISFIAFLGEIMTYYCFKINNNK